VRQKTIDVLCESFARDEMDVEEFEKRVELVERADSMEQLRAILADLPSASLPTPSVAVAPRPSVSPERVPGHSVAVGIMGGGGRAGAWVAARNNWAVSVLGGCKIDLRDAQLGPGVTEVRVLGILGGIDVLVPPDVRVECSGVGILGGFTHHGGPDSTQDPDAPVIRVSGLAILGGVRVRVRHPGESARDARVRRKAERKAKKLLEKRRGSET
jgi:hypothetical protein